MVHDPNYYHIAELIDVLWRLGIIPCQYNYINEEEDEFSWFDDDELHAKVLRYYDKMAIYQKRQNSLLQALARSMRQFVMGTSKARNHK